MSRLRGGGVALLSDATRLGILKILAAGPKNATALGKTLGMRQPTVSHHLGLLRTGRLVAGTRRPMLEYMALYDNLALPQIVVLPRLSINKPPMVQACRG